MSIFNYDFDEVNCVQLVRMMIRNPHVASKNVRGTNLNDMFRDVLGICFFFKQRFYKPSYLCECAINIFTAIYTLCKYNYDCVPSWRVCAWHCRMIYCKNSPSAFRESNVDIHISHPWKTSTRNRKPWNCIRYYLWLLKSANTDRRYLWLSLAALYRSWRSTFPDRVTPSRIFPCPIALYTIAESSQALIEPYW